MSTLYHRLDAQRAMLTKLVRDTDGSLIIASKQKTDVIVDANKRLAALWDQHAMRGRSRMVAQIPMQVYWQLRTLGITRDPAALLQWLDRDDARFFRVDGGGRLSLTPTRSHAHVR